MPLSENCHHLYTPSPKIKQSYVKRCVGVMSNWVGNVKMNVLLLFTQVGIGTLANTRGLRLVNLLTIYYTSR